MKRIILLAACALALSGCTSFGFIEDTGIGRAWDRAWFGTPAEVVSAVQFMDETMQRELKGKYEAIYDAPVTNPDGSINKQAAENRFRDLAITHAEIERWRRLCDAMADYLGVELDNAPGTDEKRADKARRQFWNQLQKSAKDALDELKEDDDE